MTRLTNTRYQTMVPVCCKISAAGVRPCSDIPKASSTLSMRGFLMDVKFSLWSGQSRFWQGAFLGNPCPKSYPVLVPIARRVRPLAIGFNLIPRSPFIWRTYLHTRKPSLKEQSILYVKNASTAIFYVCGLAGKSLAFVRDLLPENQLLKRRVLS